MNPADRAIAKAQRDIAAYRQFIVDVPHIHHLAECEDLEYRNGDVTEADGLVLERYHLLRLRAKLGGETLRVYGLAS